jgi:Polyketide cyclase / dehydrase and lipid transport
MPTPRRGVASIHISAPPDLVHELVADVTRMGEWSPECYRCEWLDGTTSASVGARFRGYNRRGRYRWERTAIVQAADPAREFAFTTIDDRTGRHETNWHYTMEPSASGTLLSERFEFLWCSITNRAVEAFLPRGRQVQHGVEETLTRIKRAAEAMTTDHAG